MTSNLDRYKNDLEALLLLGEKLQMSMEKDIDAKSFRGLIEKAKLNYEEYVKILPDFRTTYQKWYSESIALIKQVLPERLADFTSLYEKPKNRKELSVVNYVIDDFLQGISTTRLGEEIVGTWAARTQFAKQLAIVAAAQARFESSLFDIRTLVQADLLDTELDSARLLSKNKFYRAAGAICGVVIEKHLKQVCDNHGHKIAKAHPTISDMNDLLKNQAVIEVVQWRFIQHLGDLRNMCDHSKDKEPGATEITDLILGTEKITKTIF